MKKLQVSLFLLFSLLALNRSVEAQNPILPLNTFVPDVEAHVGVDGRMYIYGSWDNNLTSWGSNIQHVFSSADLINWTDHGEVFHSSGTHDDVPWTDALLYAPDAILNNGVTYMYFCLSDGSEGVAKSNSPAGPFTDAVKFNGLSAIDPAVIVDDDGQAYYYWGQFNSFGAKLKPNLTEIDMTSVKDSLITEKEHFFHEGSSMRKHNGIYYYVYASTVRKGRPTCLAYSTSTSPLGPFKYQGVIIDNAGCDPNTWNNHGSIAEFNGKWYVFYHRSSQGNQYNRRVCMEPISFNADGTIDEVPMTTQGAAEPLKANLIIEAERACFLQGKLYNRAISAKNEVLKGIRNNDAAAYKYINFDVPVDSFKISVFPGAKPVSLSITLDNSSVPIGEVLIPGNGDGNTSQTFTCKITATTGVHAVWLKVKGDADDLLKIDWFTFYQNSTCEIKKITPFLRVNGLDIEQISGKTLNVGDKVSLEPEALTNGIWSWSGPKKFSESTRIVTLNNIQRDQFGSYTATFTNDCGETSIQYFNVDFIGVEIPAKIQAEDYVTMAGIDTENTADAGGGKDVGWFDKDDFLEYRIIVPASGSYKINFRVASQPGGGKIGFSVNGANLSTTDIATTGGWQNWKTISSVVNLNKGTQLIRLTALSGGWNINWFNIEVDNSVGIAEPKTENNKIEIYPNPTTDTINIQIAKPSKITIYDINGRKVYTTQSKVKVLKIPSCEIGSKGVYLVNTNSGTQKLIIN